MWAPTSSSTPSLPPPLPPGTGRDANFTETRNEAGRCCASAGRGRSSAPVTGTAPSPTTGRTPSGSGRPASGPTRPRCGSRSGATSTAWRPGSGCRTARWRRAPPAPSTSGSRAFQHPGALARRHPASQLRLRLPRGISGQPLSHHSRRTLRGAPVPGGRAGGAGRRMRHAAAVRLGYYFPETATGVQLAYRYYWDWFPGTSATPYDPWNLRSHTGEARVFQGIAPDLELRLLYRVTGSRTGRRSGATPSPTVVLPAQRTLSTATIQARARDHALSEAKLIGAPRRCGPIRSSGGSRRAVSRSLTAITSRAPASAAPRAPGRLHDAILKRWRGPSARMPVRLSDWRSLARVRPPSSAVGQRSTPSGSCCWGPPFWSGRSPTRGRRIARPSRAWPGWRASSCSPPSTSASGSARWRAAPAPSPGQGLSAATAAWGLLATALLGFLVRE